MDAALPGVLAVRVAELSVAQLIGDDRRFEVVPLPDERHEIHTAFGYLLAFANHAAIGLVGLVLVERVPEVGRALNVAFADKPHDGLHVEAVLGGTAPSSLDTYRERPPARLPSRASRRSDTKDGGPSAHECWTGTWRGHPPELPAWTGQPTLRYQCLDGRRIHGDDMGRHTRTSTSYRSDLKSTTGQHAVPDLCEDRRMSELATRIVGLIGGSDAERVLRKYYDGRYTGALFDTADQLRSQDPNRFTPEDLLAVATLSVPLPGAAVEGILAKENRLAELLYGVDDIHLRDASDDVLDRLYKLQAVLDEVPDVGHVTRSKLLAHKRPALVPIRDQHVLTALIGQPHGSFTQPLRDALNRSQESATGSTSYAPAQVCPDISDLRTLDVVVWMLEHGDQQVADKTEPQQPLPRPLRTILRAVSRSP